MKNKGFTLVELLAVIALLVLIFMIVYPKVINVIDRGQEVTYQKQIDTILSATYDWSLKNSSRLPESGESAYVTLGELKNIGLVDADITNPITMEVFPDDLVISINNVGSSKQETNEYSRKYGDYLYTVQIGSKITMNPVIELKDLTPNSSGDYVTKVDLNSIFENNDYKATSSMGKDITDKVVVNIMYENRAVEKIDTSKIGIYYINYTVVDETGKSVGITRNVIVSDLSAPTITLPENNTIGTDITTFDLMNGVSCSDNSGNCDITHTGDITYGVVGKYIIEYTARDASGNTSTAKRVITVK